MTVYVRQKSFGFKWLLALAVFVVAMCVTFDEVYGLSMPAIRTQSTQPPPTTPSGWDMYSFENYDYPTPALDRMAAAEPGPSEIPEPTTLILLGAGCGALLLMRRKS